MIVKIIKYNKINIDKPFKFHLYKSVKPSKMSCLIEKIDNLPYKPFQRVATGKFWCMRFFVHFVNISHIFCVQRQKLAPKFSRIRCRLLDLGKTPTPCFICQARTTWLTVAPCFSAILVKTGSWSKTGAFRRTRGQKQSNLLCDLLYKTLKQIKKLIFT